MITMFILGMILLLVNVVLISMIRVSYRTDAKIKVRQGTEFALEVIDRSVKSANPESITVDENVLDINFSESNMHVQFLKEDIEDVGVIKAVWGARELYLTSPSLMDVNEFTVSMISDPETGTRRVSINITADSIYKTSDNVPSVQGYHRQGDFVTSRSEI